VIKHFQIRNGCTRYFGFFFNNASDDEHDFPFERKRHNRISRYYEVIVLTYSLTGNILKKRKREEKIILLYYFTFV